MLELVVALGLIALNGCFSLSELAIVSSRKSRLRTMVDQGRVGARAALSLAEEPGRFLSTVQIGITLVGIVAGAFSGAALGERLTTILEANGMPDKFAEPVGYTRPPRTSQTYVPDHAAEVTKAAQAAKLAKDGKKKD